ncbi:MAG: M50 family metallopeptidase [Candidatus Obscuribacterales bacterium]|nr:M50 family metallopeptidase [Candidatus Obscuribacterales bacterium]
MNSDSESRRKRKRADLAADFDSADDSDDVQVPEEEVEDDDFEQPVRVKKKKRRKKAVSDDAEGYDSSINASLFWFLTFLAIFLAQVPYVSVLFTPITQFTTLVHELGHAVVCVLTGGQVGGLTIVSDGSGHGGVTYTRGGIPFFYTQAGYLGTAFFGSTLIYLGQYPNLSKNLLIWLGIGMGIASISLIGGNILYTGLAGVGSFFWAAAMSVFLVLSGMKLKSYQANLLLLFLATQTALNSFTGVFYLVQLYLHMVPSHGAWSDASNMSKMFPFLPATFWSLFWCFCSVIMLTFSIWHTYGKRLFQAAPKKKKSKKRRKRVVEDEF